MSNRKVKIVTIGGGSSYNPELIDGFIQRRDHIDIGEIWLVDVKSGEEKLQIVTNLARRQIEAAGLDWAVRPTLDRREALEGADYVTTQLRVGGLEGRKRDERIPLGYGILGQETNGAGGIMMAFRSIPVIMDVLSEMRELAPDAWLINFANPSGMVTEAAINYAGWNRTIGLCNEPIIYGNLPYEILGKDPKKGELFLKFAGINHMHWHRVWDNAGNELTDEMIRRIYHPDTTDKIKSLESVKHMPLVYYEMLASLHLLTHYYHKFYYLKQETLAQGLADYTNHTTRAEEVQRLEKELFEVYKNPDLNTKPTQLGERGGAYYSDAACDVIISLENDLRKLMVVSTQNHGAVPDLPFNSVVEVSSIITSHGPEPLAWGAFDPAVRGMLQLQKAMEECVVEAAVNGDYERALQSFMINPLIPSGQKTKEMLDVMLVANKAYLPQFAGVIENLEKTGVVYDPKRFDM